MGKIKYMVKQLKDRLSERKQIIPASSGATQEGAVSQNGIAVQRFLIETEVYKIVVPTLAGIKCLRIDKIICCEADKSYTTLHTDCGKPFMVSRKLIEFERALLAHKFFRVHKSHLINLAHIDEFIKEGGVILMNNKMRIPVSRHKKGEFLDALIYRS